jgi:predicted oxidoreductase
MTELRFENSPRPLGATGIMVSPLAWGMWRFAGNDVQAAAARVNAALDAGITLFDTADIYGPDNAEDFGAAEALLGRVLAADTGLRRRMVLASKGGIRMGVPYDSAPDYIAAAVDASLARLGVDTLDLWQIHRPDLLAHPAQTAAALDALVASGRVRAVGVSNHTHAQIGALKKHLKAPLASVQPEFSCLATAPLFDGVMDSAMKHGLAVLAWSPLAQGRLGDGAGAGAHAVTALLDAHAANFGVSRSAVAYAWVGVHPSGAIPIVGTQNPARIADAANAFKVRFSRQQWYAILQAGMGSTLP